MIGTRGCYKNVLTESFEQKVALRMFLNLMTRCTKEFLRSSSVKLLEVAIDYQILIIPLSFQVKS